MLETPYSDVLDTAIRAGEAIMRIYAQADMGVEYKTDESPLTLADKLANELICNGLLVYNYPIISEENAEIPYEIRKNYTYYWLIDPLDGTKEFIKRNGEFTVNIALIHKDKAVFGVVHVPAEGVTYIAAEGKGAFCVNAKKEFKKIHVKIFAETDTYLLFVTSRSHYDAKTSAFIEAFDAPQFTNIGSALKFMRIADGTAHIYPRFAPCMEWDTAAAQIIVEEAGGSILDADTFLPLRYNKKSLYSPFFICYGNKENIQNN